MTSGQLRHEHITKQKLTKNN